MLSSNQISVFLNRQYLINKLTSSIDFLHVERKGWKEQGLLMDFLKKFLFEQTDYFRPKNDTSL